MTFDAIQIEAASRLHFGLLSFGATDDRRQFGGVGVMVTRPGVRLTARPASKFHSLGPMSDRVESFAKRWSKYTQVDELPACVLRTEFAAPQHAGLGTGTQLGLSVAALLYRFTQQPIPPITRLAESVGRGRRSSVGIYGFDQGGLIFELGKRPHESFGRLAERIELPSQWRVVQCSPRIQPGLSGAEERKAFRALPKVPPRVTKQLVDLVQDQMLPAARAAQIDVFGDSVYHYGVVAGQCFASQQGGRFASPQLERWVQRLRARGVHGVGQSSWGPTLFAIVENGPVGEELVRWFRRDAAADYCDLDASVSSISNCGAQLETMA